jgi:hypothetical protein
MDTMYVFSGNCLSGECGLPTGLKDWKGDELRTGDIVLIQKDGHVPDHLTVVVTDKWTTYSGGTYVAKDGPEKFFVMGIKDALPDDWAIVLVKSVGDVVPGEHWDAYGFNYRTGHYGPKVGM